MSMQNVLEEEANESLQRALAALADATQRCTAAGYGSLVLGPLDTAMLNLQYATNVATEQL